MARWGTGWAKRNWFWRSAASYWFERLIDGITFPPRRRRRSGFQLPVLYCTEDSAGHCKRRFLRGIRRIRCCNLKTLARLKAECYLTKITPRHNTNTSPPKVCPSPRRSSLVPFRASDKQILIPTFSSLFFFYFFFFSYPSWCALHHFLLSPSPLPRRRLSSTPRPSTSLRP